LTWLIAPFLSEYWIVPRVDAVWPANCEHVGPVGVIYLGLDPPALQAVRQEHTTALHPDVGS
jgi:hypothetical protein